MYATIDEVKSFSHIRKEDLGYTSDADFNAFLEKVIGYADALIDEYCGQSFSDPVPSVIKYVSIIASCNILSSVLKRKVSPVLESGEDEVRSAVGRALDNELRGLLKPYQKLMVKREGEV